MGVGRHERGVSGAGGEGNEMIDLAKLYWEMDGSADAAMLKGILSAPEVKDEDED